MMRVARVAAQAKINLLLRVGPADPTGYHELVTVFQRVDLSDDITVRVGGRGRSLDADGPAMPADGLGSVDRNLAFRAALAYHGACGWPEHFAIELTKQIPVGGGLGGGSADAGAVLRALDVLSPRPLGEERLVGLGSRLGADVAFLTSPHVRAIGRGRGDRLTPMAALPSVQVLLVIPPFGIPTADAYRWLDEDGAGSLATWLPEAAEGLRGADSWDAMTAAAHNDFERPVEHRFPELAAIRSALRESGARIALLSGSGSTVFGIFDRAPDVPAALPAGTRVVASRSAGNVVQVEVLQ